LSAKIFAIYSNDAYKLDADKIRLVNVSIEFDNLP